MAIPVTLTGKALWKFPSRLSRQPRSIQRSSGFYCSMANTVRVGAVQMTSTNDLDANYHTCSRLVKEAAADGVKFLCFPENFSFVTLFEMVSDVKRAANQHEPSYRRVLSGILASMLRWTEKRLLDYHESFGRGNLASMEKILSLVLSTGRILAENLLEIARTTPWFTERILTIIGRVELYIQLSLPSAFTKLFVTGHWHIDMIVEVDEDPDDILIRLAKDTEALGPQRGRTSSPFSDSVKYDRESNIWLSLGGFQEKGSDDAHIHNTHVLVDDTGNIRSTYRKIHLFDVDVPGNMAYKESSFTTAGNAIVVEDSPAGRLGLTVCYDLRFPELYHQLRFEYNAQVLLVPSAFTKVTGEAHWEILLRARAIETQCFVIAAAQAGKHNEKRESYGDSLIIDPWGTILARLPDRSSTGIAVADIDLSKISSIRAWMPIAKHRKFSISSSSL